jgi:hypothetical protein
MILCLKIDQLAMGNLCSEQLGSSGALHDKRTRRTDLLMVLYMTKYQPVLAGTPGQGSYLPNWTCGEARRD